LAPTLKLRLRLVAQIEEPGGMGRRAAARGDDDEAVAFLAVDQRRRLRGAAFAPGRLQQQTVDRRQAGQAEIDLMPVGAVALEVKLDVTLLPARRARFDLHRHPHAPANADGR